MIAAALITAAALTLTPATVPTDRTVDPSRGGVGRYLDSNVSAVWAGASHAERAVWLCIRNHESRHAGHYTARNPSSSASGAGQWIRATWQGLAPWVRVNGRPVAARYPEAYLAPAWVQDAAFRHVYARNGLHMWRGTGCPGT